MDAVATLLAEARHFLRPLGDAVSDPDQPDAFLDLLSDAYIDGELVYEITVLETAASALSAAWVVVDALGEGTIDVSDIGSAANAIKAAVDAAKGLGEATTLIDSPQAAGEVIDRLFDHLLGLYLSDRAPALLASLAIASLSEEPNADTQQSWRFYPDRLGRWITDPEGMQRDHVGWGSASFDAELWVERLARLAEAIGRPVTLSPREPVFLDPALAFAEEPPARLVATLLLAGGIDGLAQISMRLEASPESDATGDQGFGIGLEGGVQAQTTLPLDADGNRTLTLSFEGALPDDAFVSIRPDFVGFIGPSGLPDLVAEANVPAPADGSLSLGLGPLALTVPQPGVSVSLGTDTDGVFADFRVALRGVSLGLDAAQADGFAAAILEPLPEVDLDLTMGMHSRKGPYFDLDGGLTRRIDLPPLPGLPIQVKVIELSLETGQNSDIALSARLDLEAELGPVFASVEGIGATMAVDLASRSDAFAPDFSFLPPRGAALSIDLPSVQGGGYIAHDPDVGRYSGALSLKLPAFGLGAFGLVDTRMPDGSDGWSALVFVNGEFAPIPLGFGFTLNGVGGLAGLHRDVDVDALFAAVRTGAAGDLLAPENPVEDGPELISTAATIFPARRGQYVFGPTVQLGWGTPIQLVSLDLALAVTLPEPLRIILIGRAQMALPDPDLSLIRINLDLAGVLDLSASRLDMEGALFDSVVQGIPIEGGFALRSSWGARRELAFSVGGLHPAVEAPPGFPTLARMGIDLSRSSAFQLRLVGYFAVTSNAVMLGASADLRVSKAGFLVLADAGFDALVEFEPFGVDLQVRAGAEIRKGNRTLASIRIKGRLQGPGPWRVNGSATLEVAFIDVDLGFSHAFGAPAAPLAPPPDLAAALVAELGKPASWGDGGTGASSVRLGDLGDALSPAANISVAQGVAPLDTPITSWQGRALSETLRVRITGLSNAGSVATPTRSVDKPFAPAKFANMSETQRLSAPGFEDMPAGAEFAPSDVGRSGPAVTVTDAPESIVVDTTTGNKGTAAPIARADLLPGLTPAPKGQITVRDEGWDDGTGTRRGYLDAGPTDAIHRVGELQ